MYLKVVLLGKVSKSGTLWKGTLRWFSVERYLKVVLCGRYLIVVLYRKVSKSGTL